MSWISPQIFDYHRKKHYYMVVMYLSCSFIEEKSSFEYGQVNHALTAAMRTLMKEYLILVTQLEHLQRQGLLSLQKLWFYIQPTMRTMEILASIGESLTFVSFTFLWRWLITFGVHYPTISIPAHFISTFNITLHIFPLLLGHLD